MASSTDPRLRCAQGSLTAGAAIDTGTVIVPAMPGRTLTVVDGWMRAIGGAAGGGTGIYVKDSTTGTVACEWLVGDLTQNAVARLGGGTTVATNLGTALAGNEGLKIVKHGNNITTATSVDYCIYYTVGI